jgi:hypothetical protein
MNVSKLKAVIATLNSISVCGKNNLNALLASIQALEKMLEEAKEVEADY